MAKITRVEQAVPTIKTKKKVAAYARISMESERMNHSLSAQISYYSSLIQKNPDWQYAGVFADDGISGTGIAKRDEFKRMIEAADNGEIEIFLAVWIQSHDSFENDPPFEYPLNPLFSNRYRYSENPADCFSELWKNNQLGILLISIEIGL